MKRDLVCQDYDSFPMERKWSGIWLKVDWKRNISKREVESKKTVGLEDWKQIGSRLEAEADWKQTGNKLEANWKQTGSRLKADWRQTESRLEADGRRLEVDQKWNGSKLKKDLNQTWNRLEADWKQTGSRWKRNDASGLPPWVSKLKGRLNHLWMPSNAPRFCFSFIIPYYARGSYLLPTRSFPFCIPYLTCFPSVRAVKTRGAGGKGAIPPGFDGSIIETFTLKKPTLPPLDF